MQCRIRAFVPMLLAVQLHHYCRALLQAKAWRIFFFCRSFLDKLNRTNSSFLYIIKTPHKGVLQLILSSTTRLPLPCKSWCSQLAKLHAVKSFFTPLKSNWSIAFIKLQLVPCSATPWLYTSVRCTSCRNHFGVSSNLGSTGRMEERKFLLVSFYSIFKYHNEFVIQRKLTIMSAS